MKHCEVGAGSPLHRPAGGPPPPLRGRFAGEDETSHAPQLIFFHPPPRSNREAAEDEASHPTQLGFLHPPRVAGDRPEGGGGGAATCEHLRT